MEVGGRNGARCALELERPWLVDGHVGKAEAFLVKLTWVSSLALLSDHELG